MEVRSTQLLGRETNGPGPGRAGRLHCSPFLHGSTRLRSGVLDAISQRLHGHRRQVLKAPLPSLATSRQAPTSTHQETGGPVVQTLAPLEPTAHQYTDK